MQKIKITNMSRFTYLKTAFQGWRVSISRKRQHFVRYFSDKAYGGEEQSRAAAQDVRDRILAELAANPDNVKEIFDRYR